MPNFEGFDRSKIYAHRGLWGEGIKENSLEAIRLAASLGYSVETDLRDYLGEVVLSHDVLQNEVSNFVRFNDLMTIEFINSNQTLALNVKSDGLISLLEGTTFQQKHFFFDLSVPETLKYERANRPVSKRVSEYEPVELVNASSKEFKYVWLDSFESDWFINSGETNKLFKHLKKTNEIIVVSPELHDRNPLNVWLWCANLHLQGHNISICTDLVNELESFLVEKFS